MKPGLDQMKNAIVVPHIASASKVVHCNLLSYFVPSSSKKVQPIGPNSITDSLLILVKKNDVY